MCPVPKEVEETDGQATPSVPVASADAATDLDPTVGPSDLINNNFNKPSPEEDISNSNIEPNIRYSKLNIKWLFMRRIKF